MSGLALVITEPTVGRFDMLLADAIECLRVRSEIPVNPRDPSGASVYQHLYVVKHNTGEALFNWRKERQRRTASPCC